MVQDNNIKRKIFQYSLVSLAVFKTASFKEFEIMSAVVKKAVEAKNKENKKLVIQLAEKGEGIMLFKKPPMAATIMTANASPVIQGRKRKVVRMVSAQLK